ncbi:hypothetical protein [Mesorhizobium marinum]|uniref:hypothetical protein n=1 Tax=Mesorhizobium marinum TaxID=3228790 RepID=UPI003466E7CD
MAFIKATNPTGGTPIYLRAEDIVAVVAANAPLNKRTHIHLRRANEESLSFLVTEDADEIMKAIAAASGTP